MESAELFKALKGSVFYLSPESPKNGSGKEKKGVIDGVRTIFFVRNHFWGVLDSDKRENLLEP